MHKDVGAHSHTRAGTRHRHGAPHTHTHRHTFTRRCAHPPRAAINCRSWGLLSAPGVVGKAAGREGAGESAWKALPLCLVHTGPTHGFHPCCRQPADTPSLTEEAAVKANAGGWASRELYPLALLDQSGVQGGSGRSSLGPRGGFGNPLCKGVARVNWGGWVGGSGRGPAMGLRPGWAGRAEGRKGIAGTDSLWSEVMRERCPQGTRIFPGGLREGPSAGSPQDGARGWRRRGGGGEVLGP